MERRRCLLGLSRVVTRESNAQKSETIDSFLVEVSRHKNFSRSVSLGTGDGSAVPLDDVNDERALA